MSINIEEQRKYIKSRKHEGDRDYAAGFLYDMALVQLEILETLRTISQRVYKPRIPGPR